MLLSPLPEARWLIFVNRDEDDQGGKAAAAAELAALLKARIGGDVGLEDLRWVSEVPTHKRVVPSLERRPPFPPWRRGTSFEPDGRRGDQLALMDGANLAWKLALSFARRPNRLSESYSTERGIADRHVLDVERGPRPRHAASRYVPAARRLEALPPQDPAQAIAGLRKRSMLDVSYQGSLLVDAGSATTPAGDAGARFPGWCDRRRDPPSRRLRRRAAAGRFPHALGRPLQWLNGCARASARSRRGLPRARCRLPGWVHRLPARADGHTRRR